MEPRETSTQISSANTDLYILGAGVSFPEQLTIETVEVLGQCGAICTNLREENLSFLPPDLRTKCKSLWGLYIDGRHRLENYLAVADEVLRIAETSRPTAWLTPGHPLIFDSVSADLLQRGRTRGWTVRVLPAISCLDTILGDVEYDPAKGIFIYEATGLVRRKVGIPPNIAVLLLQPSVFNIDHALISPEAEGPDLLPLQQYLLNFYRSAHRCAFVRSASRMSGAGQLVWREIGSISSLAYRDIAGSTLFIPNAEAVNWPAGAKGLAPGD